MLTFCLHLRFFLYFFILLLFSAEFGVIGELVGEFFDLRDSAEKPSEYPYIKKEDIEPFQPI